LFLFFWFEDDEEFSLRCVRPVELVDELPPVVPVAELPVAELRDESFMEPLELELRLPLPLES